MFIDESKSRGFLIAAAVSSRSGLPETRSQLRRLLLPGQERLHFTKEADGRRRSILTKLQTLDLEVVTITAAGELPDLQAREACLREAVRYCATASVDRLTIETDESTQRFDRQVLFNEQHRTHPELTYCHRRSKEEPMLWVADAVAWCWGKGKPWKGLADPLVTVSLHVP